MLFIKALWLLLPAGFSNMSPIVAQKLFPKYNTPIDFGKTLRHQEIFGSHKTYRGLISGTLTGLFIFYIQKNLFEYSSFVRSLSLIDYQNINPLFGAVIGLGALLGDLIKSFFKRRLNIKPGKPWIPFDEIDWIVGALISISFIFTPGWSLIAACLIVGVGSHFLIRGVAYLLHFVSTPL